MIVTKLSACRVCGNSDLEQVLDLGEQELTGVFPRTKEEILTAGKLDLLFCPKCGLLQLGHSYSLDEMYGENYGYRSGLNQSMVTHLKSKVQHLSQRYHVSSGDIVLDIGSNDGTTLNSYTVPNIKRIGMDPTSGKFKQYYDEGIEIVTDFFSAENFVNLFGSQKAKIVTSISMFYDLENPIAFAADVASILADNGVWHLEQSYMPTMLRQNAYDTVCHEHLEYYSLGVIKYIMETVGLRIVDVSMNDINGGSFAVTVAKKNSPIEGNDSLVNWVLHSENKLQLRTSKPFVDFAKRVTLHKTEFTELLEALLKDGKSIYGYGASTKGNVILQYCGITSKQILGIAEVNPDKYGAFTPKTHIPILAEQEVKDLHPDYMIVFPWHFRNNVLQREQEYLRQGGHFIFPLPFIEIV